MGVGRCGGAQVGNGVGVPVGAGAVSSQAETISIAGEGLPGGPGGAGEGEGEGRAATGTDVGGCGPGPGSGDCLRPRSMTTRTRATTPTAAQIPGPTGLFKRRRADEATNRTPVSRDPDASSLGSSTGPKYHYVWRVCRLNPHFSHPSCCGRGCTRRHGVSRGGAACDVPQARLAAPWSKRRADGRLRALATEVCEKCGLIVNCEAAKYAKKSIIFSSLRTFRLCVSILFSSRSHPQQPQSSPGEQQARLSEGSSVAPRIWKNRS